MQEEYREAKRIARKIIWGIILFITVGSIVGLGVRSCTKATHVEDAVIIYEEYQEIYNTCMKINTDLCNMKNIPDTDPMFEQFSKNQRILALQTNLNRWVEEYNAKSKMWGGNITRHSYVLWSMFYDYKRGFN